MWEPLTRWLGCGSLDWLKHICSAFLALTKHRFIMVHHSTYAATWAPQVAAFGIAALSSFFNGSFPACQRIPRGPPLDPVLFNCLVCVGVFFSSLLIPLVFNQDWIAPRWGPFIPSRLVELVGPGKRHHCGWADCRCQMLHWSKKESSGHFNPSDFSDEDRPIDLMRHLLCSCICILGLVAENLWDQRHEPHWAPKHVSGRKKKETCRHLWPI